MAYMFLESLFKTPGQVRGIPSVLLEGDSKIYILWLQEFSIALASDVPWKRGLKAENYKILSPRYSLLALDVPWKRGLKAGYGNHVEFCFCPCLTLDVPWKRDWKSGNSLYIRSSSVVPLHWMSPENGDWKSQVMPYRSLSLPPLHWMSPENGCKSARREFSRVAWNKFHQSQPSYHRP